MVKIIKEGKVDQLDYYVFHNRNDMGEFSAELVKKEIKYLTSIKDEIRIVFASAPSQKELLENLTADPEIEWSKIVAFHMDEYLDVPKESTNSFSGFIKKNLESKVDLKKFYPINGLAVPDEEIKRYSKLLLDRPIDIVCLGIGENGHIAFNDPHVANFEDPNVLKLVELDNLSRQQQVNDKVFETISHVPKHALTLTISTLLSANCLVCTVPGVTKKSAIYEVLKGEINTQTPATILREHKNSHLILDQEAFGGRSR